MSNGLKKGLLYLLAFSLLMFSVSCAKEPPKEPLAGPFVKETGFCWIADLPKHEGSADNVKDGNRSKLVLYEDGKALGPAHSIHDEIRQKGQGRFSHWGKSVYFSTSDNSDPSTNGRKYFIAIVEKQ